MSAATVPVANASRSEMEGKNASYHGSISGFVQIQCSPMPQPALGFQRTIHGNGTSVGTVISLQCPDKHKLIGDSVKCVFNANTTHWEGETYCTRNTFLPGISGFHLAILLSIVSSAIILFMSMAFLTCCLVDCIEKRKRKEMARYPEMPPQWEGLNHQQEMNRPQYSNKGRNNNNNNIREEELTHLDPGQRDHKMCRCQQQYKYDPVGPSCSYNAASRFPVLPGYEYDQPLLPLNPSSSNIYNQPIGVSRQCLSSDLVHVDSSRSDLVWNYGTKHQGTFPGATDQAKNKKSTKEFSIRVISV